SAAIVMVVFRIDESLGRYTQNENRGQQTLPPMIVRALLGVDFRLAVAQAIDGAVPVIRDEHRTVLHLHHVNRTANILVVLEEAGDDRLDVLDRAVLVQMGDDDVTTELVGAIPRTVTRDDGLVLEARR